MKVSQGRMSLVTTSMCVPIIGMPFMSTAFQNAATLSNPWALPKRIPIPKVKTIAAAIPTGSAIVHRSKAINVEPPPFRAEPHSCVILRSPKHSPVTMYSTRNKPNVVASPWSCTNR